MLDTLSVVKAWVSLAYICQYHLIPNIMLHISAPEHATDINYVSSQSPPFTLSKKLITLINLKI